jgi:translation initiation factor 4G
LPRGFERGWKSKEATASANLDKATCKRCALLQAKRQGLGLVMFIGELFKVQMLRERVMHECIKKLLNNVDDPKAERLCALLTTVGERLDTPRGGPYLDDYFARMRKLVENPKVNNRMRRMLLVRSCLHIDVLEHTLIVSHCTGGG